ncbi:MAG: homoserine kinase [Cellvibrionaceae bacterium]|jgi:homoserine kinase
MKIDIVAHQLSLYRSSAPNYSQLWHTVRPLRKILPMSTITVTVPATTANIGPGFDCLGMALNLRNEFQFTPCPEGLTIGLNGEGIDSIPTDKNNLIVQAMQFLCDYVGRPLPSCHIEQTNHVPAASGLGSSSTAIVAGLMGANALLDNPIDKDCILKLATRMEGHPDNVAPAIFGGLVLVPMGDNGEALVVERITMPSMTVALVLPDFELLTADARAALPTHVSRADAIFNMARVPLVLRALEKCDYKLMNIAIDDRIHQPYRMALVPGMQDAFAAARTAGAAAVAISGAGPSTIAFAADNHDAIGRAMIDAYAAAGLSARMWLLETDNCGSTVD